MKLKVNGVSISLRNEENDILNKISKKTQIKSENIKSYKILRESIDARNKDDIKINYTFEVEVKDKVKPSLKYEIINEKEEILKIESLNKTLNTRPIIVGFGPAGMLAGLFLARNGFNPLIIERGSKVEKREKDIEAFFYESRFNSESNIQFGEGGAGTFSDGKLTTRSKDKRVKNVLEILHQHGASDEILYKNKPHIGTDVLKKIVVSIRHEIESLGGEVCFDTKLLDIIIDKNKKIKAIKTNKDEIPCEVLILAIGHSARDTVKNLAGKLKMENKAFAVGFRVEHSQEFINLNQYGDFAKDKRLKAAEYVLTHRSINNRGVYSFCMCPGGMVVPSSSEEETVVVNGMSYSDRGLENANSAIVVNINPEDYGEKLFDGIEFQENIERISYKLGGGNYFAPVQNIHDFLGIKNNSSKSVTPSYPIGIEYTKLEKIYPEFINIALKDALFNFDRKIKGFSSGVLTGSETRTSSTIRMLRGENFESEETLGVYPAGEGAGYSGGIMSSAIDGLKIAEKIVSLYKSFN